MQLLVVSSGIPREVIAGLRKCRVISRLARGPIRSTYPPPPSAEFLLPTCRTFASTNRPNTPSRLLLAFCRRLPFMIDAMRRGNWTARSHADVHRLAGRTMGLVGFGAGGAQAVAVRAAAFGLRLLAWVRNREKYAAVADRLGVTLAPLNVVLSTADYVSLHLPLTAETRGSSMQRDWA